MRTLLTYVSSSGVNLVTGEVYPDGAPRQRTVSEVYNLLLSGHKVEERLPGGVVIELDSTAFFKNNFNELQVAKQPVQDTVKIEKIKK